MTGVDPEREQGALHGAGPRPVQGLLEGL